MRKVFWGSLAALAWTHVGYPAAAAVAARIAPKPVRREDILPTVTIIVAAHNEEDVIERRIENLLRLDYPSGDVEIVVASDASTDRTHEIVREVAEREQRVRLLECPARRQGGGAKPRRRALEVRRRGLLGCECHLGARCASAARACVRRPGGRVRLRPARAGGRGRHERRGCLLAPGDIAA